MELDKNPTQKNIVIPLFPLPTTVFYPNTSLPLHIFELRYRNMVVDALQGEGKIGMVLLRSGWENDYQGTPEIMPIGCVGRIDRHSQLPEGKFNILLSGLHRFRILHEIQGKLYRQAQVEILEEINDHDLTASTLPIKQRLIENIEQYLKNIPNGDEIELSLDLGSCAKLAELVDKVVYHFDLPASKMQEFLEEQDVQKRANSLHTLVELKNQLIKISKKIKDGGVDFSMN